MSRRVIVVGGGASGLIAATLLAPNAEVTLVERLPAPSGQEPEGAGGTTFVEQAQALGVTMRLATLGVRWDSCRLHTLGSEGAAAIKSDVLVLATGTRPATAAEIGIAGDRFAGVIPGPAAVHLTESGVLLGRNPVVLGGGSLAARCLRLLQDAGARHVTVVAPDGVLDADIRQADNVIEGWSVVRVRGAPRLQAVALGHVGSEEWIAADALVLAHRRVPMRNIEGAIFDREGVVFCHSQADPKSLGDARETARRAVVQALAAAAKSKPTAGRAAGHS